jgi:hypothetical protein
MVGLLLLLLPLAGMAKGGIPMVNATCPGGLSIHADEGGPVYVDGRETTLKRFNDNYYEARDARSGVTLSISRTPDGGVQLSYSGRGGANGVCSISQHGQPARTSYASSYRDDSHSAGRDVTCESQDQRQTECDMDTQGDVRLVRQLSRARCVEGESWGLNRHSVWVKDGCRAEFRNESHGRHGGNSYYPSSGQDAVLLGACNARARAQGNLVNRVPVGEDYMELIVDYPDGRFLCMVTNEGSVMSLKPVR